MLLVLFSGIALGSCFTWILLKASKLSRRDRIEATLQTLLELQSLFCCTGVNSGTFDEIDNVRIIVEGMKRQ